MATISDETGGGKTLRLWSENAAGELYVTRGRVWRARFLGFALYTWLTFLVTSTGVEYIRGEAWWIWFGIAATVTAGFLAVLVLLVYFAFLPAMAVALLPRRVLAKRGGPVIVITHTLLWVLPVCRRRLDVARVIVHGHNHQLATDWTRWATKITTPLNKTYILDHGGDRETMSTQAARIAQVLGVTLETVDEQAQQRRARM